MKKVVIASTNPVKINATMIGFREVFPNEEFEENGISVSSGVSDQPRSDEETFRGALNRVNEAKLAVPDADYWVGLEGGVEDDEEEMRTTVWMVILSRTQMGKAKTGSFMIPPRIAEIIREGREMGDADDEVFGTTNSKQKSGAVGILTKEVLGRTDTYRVGVILALIPFINPDLYPNSFVK